MFWCRYEVGVSTLSLTLMSNDLVILNKNFERQVGLTWKNSRRVARGWLLKGRLKRLEVSRKYGCKGQELCNLNCWVYAAGALLDPLIAAKEVTGKNLSY